MHHARNRYGIDCNYAGVLIIWDRIFGTYVEEIEDPSLQISYGLVHPVQSFDPWYLQVCFGSQYFLTMSFVYSTLLNS